MFPYADYDFYMSEAKGNMSEQDFNTEIVEASSFLRYITLGKSDRIQPDVLKYAACAIADMQNLEKKKYSSGVVKSENNDGYSVSYVTELQDGTTLEQLISKKAMNIARRYLIGTSLLSRKVGGRYDYEC